MLKQLVNEARFQLTITAEGPLLVKSGHPTLVGPDMTPVLTYRNGRSEVYLPGSSLKGVFRSHIEKVMRTLRPNPYVVCNPLHGHAMRITLSRCCSLGGAREWGYLPYTQPR